MIARIVDGSEFQEFKEKFGNVRHVVYDAVSESAALDAYEAKYGTRAMASYDFSKAMTIVSVGIIESQSRSTGIFLVDL